MLSVVGCVAPFLDSDGFFGREAPIFIQHCHVDIDVVDYCMLLIKLQVQVLGIFINYYFQKISFLRLVYVSAVYAEYWT